MSKSQVKNSSGKKMKILRDVLLVLSTFSSKDVTSLTRGMGVTYMYLFASEVDKILMLYILRNSLIYNSQFSKIQESSDLYASHAV